ncbi:MAG: hypothetical protein HUK20_15440 [Fibrobacter sp.]|nr:hypothetical protein [Fibrobacter sp.]
MSYENEKHENWMSKPMTGKTWIAVIAVIAVAFYFMLGDMISSEDQTVDGSTLSSEKKPEYTEEDAMRDLKWWAETVASYPEVASSADYATARKMSNQLWIARGELESIVSMVPYSVNAAPAAKKILDVLPVVQKDVLPKLRRAWVNGENDIMSRYGVRVKCANKSCDAVTFVGDRYYSEFLARDDFDKARDEFEKLHFKKIRHVAKDGSGMNSGFKDMSDDYVH